MENPLDLEAIKARAEAATTGPWRENKPLSRNGWVVVTSSVTPIATCYLSKADEDAEFIAHAREDIPALIDRVEELEALVSFLKGAGRPLTAEQLDRAKDREIVRFQAAARRWQSRWEATAKYVTELKETIQRVQALQEEWDIALENGNDYVLLSPLAEALDRALSGTPGGTS